MTADLLTHRIRPILKWAGGKSGLLPQLLPLFPTQFKCYIEPFFGGGAVYFALNIQVNAHLNDANPELIELYETVRDEPEQLMSALDDLSQNYSEEFYYATRQSVPDSKIARAARTIFLNKTGFNGLYRQNSKGGFNVPFGKRSTCPQLYDAHNFARASHSLKSAMLHSTDFEQVIDMAMEGDFIYCDPPYEPVSSTSSFNAYKGSGFSQSDQKRLKECCVRAQKRGAYVVISNSSAQFIRDLFCDCDVRIMSARRVINSRGHLRGPVEEVAVILIPS